MAFDLESAAPVGVSPDEPPKKGFDLKSAKPVGGPKTDGGDKDEPHWFKDIVGAAVEPVISMGTGALGAVAGGVAGVGQVALHAGGFNKEAGEPGDVARRVSERLTYEPGTKGGKDAMTVFGAIPEKISEFSTEAGGKTTEFLHKKVGLPHEVAAGVGAAGNAAMQFLPQLAGSRGAGAIAERTPQVVPRILPKPSEAVEAMTARGAKLSPGQILGGGWDRWEQAMSKWPIVGAPIRGARARAFDSVNEAAYNDVLAPVKEKMPDNVKPGRAAVEYIEGKLGTRYEDILGRTKGSLDGDGIQSAVVRLGGKEFEGKTHIEAIKKAQAEGKLLTGPDGRPRLGPGDTINLFRTKHGELITRDQAGERFGGKRTEDLPPQEGAVTPPPVSDGKPTTLRQELDGLKKMIGSSKLPKKYKDEFGRIIDEDVVGRFEKSGLASGATVKEIDSSLRVLAKKKGLSDNRDVNTVGMAVKEARAALKRMVERENPELAPELKATDAAYAKFKVVQKASTYAGKEGVFTPPQFERAVKAQDPSRDKAQYARGKANMQDFAASAREAIGDAIPDSGTPSQFLAAAITESLAGKKMGILGIPGGLAAGAALSLPYSELGTRALQRGLTGPPISGVPAARALPFGAGAYPNQVTPPPQ